MDIKNRINIKKIIGWLMILSPFIALFIFFGITETWTSAVVLYLLIFVLLVYTAIGVSFIQ
jgi:4-hydroxybenzoate polyprenyltransferase